MKKRILSAVTAIIVALSVISGLGAFYAAGTHVPDNPIEFHDMNKFLFMEKEFDTRKSSLPSWDLNNEDWRNYYWCDFKPQYGADYSFAIRSEFAMRCEIYDNENNLLASGDSNTPKETDGYHLSLTYRLEKNQQYYFKFVFTDQYHDTAGKFWVYFSSGESGTLNDADHLHLTINESSTSYTYELDEYSVPKLFQDLKFIVIYPNGHFSEWISKETPIMALDGVDILLNSSDCKKEIGQHTLIAHYLGYKVEATFNIVKCKHKYNFDSITEPGWKEPGALNYKCEKCGEINSEPTLTAEELKPIVEKCLNSKYGDAVFDERADVNRDNAVNARDVAIILKAYNAYEIPTNMKGDGISQSFAEQP